jgi:transcriptional regulator with XRE-family HTH domain
MAPDSKAWPKEAGLRLRAAREAQRLTQEDLAAKVEITAPYLSKIERATLNPSSKLRRRLAEALGTTVVAIERGAESAAKASIVPALTVPALSDDYPNRGVVRARAWYQDEPEPVRRAFEGIRRETGDLPTPQAWLIVLQRLSVYYAVTGTVDIAAALFTGVSDRDEPKPPKLAPPR